MQYQKKELFQGYEIKNWNFTPRLYKLFGAAAVFNILFLFVVVQANIFTTRGCDSPLVGSFCQVLDTIYLGSTLLDTNTEFASKAYKKTELEDADITFINVSGATPPLDYPAGYFALANPESAMMTMPLDMNGSPTLTPSTSFGGFPTNPTVTNGTNLLATPQVTPTPNPKVLTGTLPDNLFSVEGIAPSKNPIPAPKNYNRLPKINRPRLGQTKSKNPVPKPPTPPENDVKTAETKPDENQPPLNSGAIPEFQPNKKPLEDFAADIVAKREDKTKPLDLTKNFKVRMIGELDKDGKLDPKKSHYLPFKPEEQGDQTMVNIGKAAIQAINDSGLFFYLKDKGVDKVDVTLVQDNEQIFAVINSSLPTKERAGTVSSGLNGLLGLAEFTVKEPELLTLVKAAKAEQQGKNVVLNFKIDKLVAQAMITKKLDEAEAKKKADEQTGKPNSTATVTTNQKTSK